MQAAEADVSQREAALAEMHGRLAAETEGLLSVLSREEPHGQAVIRLARERTVALGERDAARDAGAVLRRERDELYDECARLHARYERLLELVRRQRAAAKGASEASSDGSRSSL